MLTLVIGCSTPQPPGIAQPIPVTSPTPVPPSAPPAADEPERDNSPITGIEVDGNQRRHMVIDPTRGFVELKGDHTAAYAPNTDPRLIGTWRSPELQFDLHDNGKATLWMGSEPHHGHWSSNGTTLNVSYDAYVFPGAYPYQFGEPDELALDFEGHVPATFILLRRD